MHSVVLALALLAAVVLGTTAADLQKEEALIEWVRSLGGTVNAEIKYNEAGVRGLFADRDFEEGEAIVSVPGTAIINAGGTGDSFALPLLTILRELKTECSRFKPYIDIWPKEILNSCSLDHKYIKMLKSEYWETNTHEWTGHLKSLMSGKLNPDLEYTIDEMVGNATVTLKDLEYACALSSTRYVSTWRRKRLVLVPLFDMANHKMSCTNHINGYENGDFFILSAGEPIKKGDEICYSYGMLRDDYAVTHYGFLPDLDDPPRLSLVDHHEFDPVKQFDHEAPPSEERFNGTPEELQAELSRLQGIYRTLKATPDPLPPQPKGQDYVYDTLKELEARRLNALQYEIKRISALLNVKTEL